MRRAVTWPVEIWLFIAHVKRSEVSELINMADLDDKPEPSRHLMWPFSLVRGWVNRLLEISFNSIGRCVRELVVLQAKFSMFHSNFWCVIGVSVEVWMRIFYTGSLRVKLIFGMSRDAKMTLVHNEPIWNALHSNLHTSSNQAPRTYRAWKVMFAKQPTPNQNFGWVKGYLKYHAEMMEIAWQYTPFGDRGWKDEFS